MTGGRVARLLRERVEGGQRVTSMELFFDRLLVSRLAAIAALAALAPLGLAGPPLLLATATMVVLAAVAWSDTLIGRRILEVT